MQDYQKHFTENDQVLWFYWSSQKINYHLKLIYYYSYDDQNKCVSIININLISYIIHVSTNSLILNKWLSHKKYNIIFITDKMNVNEQAEIIQIFNNNKSLKNSTSFSDIFIDTTALIDQDYTLIKSFQLVIMKSKWLTTEKDQYVKQI